MYYTLIKYKRYPINIQNIGSILYSKQPFTFTPVRSICLLWNGVIHSVFTQQPASERQWFTMIKIQRYVRLLSPALLFAMFLTIRENIFSSNIVCYRLLDLTLDTWQHWHIEYRRRSIYHRIAKRKNVVDLYVFMQQ